MKADEERWYVKKNQNNRALFIFFNYSFSSCNKLCPILVMKIGECTHQYYVGTYKIVRALCT